MRLGESGLPVRAGLSAKEAFAVVVQLLAQFLHEFAVVDGVHVFAEQIQQEPIAYLGLVCDEPYVIAIGEPCS